MLHIRREFPGWMKLPRRGNRSCAGNQGIDFRVSIAGIRLCEITPREKKQVADPSSGARLCPSQSDFGARYSSTNNSSKNANSSETQLAEIVVADLNALKRRFRLVMFDDVVLDAGLLGLCENAVPVNDAAADRGHVFERVTEVLAPGGRNLGQFLHVLHVNEREASGVAVEVGQGVRTGDRDPAQIQLHFHEVRITLLQQHVVGQLSSYREELEPVIVIGELNAGFLADFSGMIEGIDGTFPTVGLLADLFRYPRAHDVTLADRLRGLDHGRPLVAEHSVFDVTRRRSEAIAIDHGSDLLRRAAEVAGEFDFLVADGSDLGDGAVEVGLHLVAHGIKLQADLFHSMLGSGPTQVTRKNCGGGKNLEKGSAVHAGDNTRSRLKNALATGFCESLNRDCGRYNLAMASGCSTVQCRPRLFPARHRSSVHLTTRKLCG